MKNPIALVLAAGLALSAPAFSQQPPPGGGADTRIVVKTADDLPRHTYHIEGKASEFVLSKEPYAKFLAQVKADTEADLAKYKIDDPTTLQGYYTLLQQVAMIEGRLEDAAGYTEKIKGLESKESKKLTTGLVLASLVE